MSQKWTVIIADRISGRATVEENVFGDRANVVALNAFKESELKGKIEDADAILAWHDLQWKAETLKSLTRCKGIVRVGAGYDNIDLVTARDRGIVVSNVPDYGTHDVADHSIALLLSLARGLMGHNRGSLQSPTGWVWGNVPTFRVTNKKLGIVGLGRIGTATALRAKALGMDVGFYDPYKPAGWDKALGLRRYLKLHDLAAEADVLSFHTPLTPETRGMYNQQFFRACKKGVVVVNTSRGPVMDWKAFSEAFLSGHIASAGFDVLPLEPLDTSDPLLKSWCAGEPAIRDRMLITPHCAFYSEEALHEMREKAAQEALRILSGEGPMNRVN